MGAIKNAFDRGRADALAKFALGPPTQVDQFVANVEQGQDIPPTPPTMSTPILPQDPAMAQGMPDGAMPAMPAMPPEPPNLGSTVP